MAGRGAVPMPEPGKHRQLGRVEIETGHQFGDGLAVNQFGAPAKMLVYLGALAEGSYRGIRVGEGELPPLGVHDVEIEFVGQLLVQLHRRAVKGHPFRRQVVGADNCGIARGVAAPQVGFLQHRDIGDAVVFGQVIGGGHTVPAAANDHNVIVIA